MADNVATTTENAVPAQEPTTTPEAASPDPASETKTEPAPAQAAVPAASVQTPAPAAAAQVAEPAKTETAPAEDIDAIKGENYALKAGVKPEYTADVITLAKSRVKDGTTLEQAVNEVVNAYPAFKNTPPPVTSSTPVSNDEALAAAAEDERINRVMGIRPEKKGE